MSDNNTVHPRDMWGTATREPAWKSLGGGILERMSADGTQRNQIKRDQNNVWRSVKKEKSATAP